jgi:hypothetical protein
MPKNGPPPLPDGRETWAHDTPRPTSPPPPRRTDRPRVIRSVGQAVAIHEALCSLGHAVRQLKEAGLSDADIEQIFRTEMKPSWDEAKQ